MRQAVLILLRLHHLLQQAKHKAIGFLKGRQLTVGLLPALENSGIGISAIIQKKAACSEAEGGLPYSDGICNHVRWVYNYGNRSDHFIMQGAFYPSVSEN
jgi:hypothetical protein